MRSLINRNLIILFCAQLIFVSGSVVLVTLGGIVGNDGSQACRFNPGLGNILRPEPLLEKAGEKNGAYRQNCDRLVIQNAQGISSSLKR